MRATKTLITLLTALVALFAASVAHAAPGMEKAIEDEDVFVDGKTLSPNLGYQRLADLGVRRMRILVTSSSVRTGNGFDFGKYDRAVNAAAQRGIRVQMVLIGRYPRPNVKEFATFANTTAAHFKGRVDRYSIWNEPNYIAWLAPQRKAPALYRRLYLAGYKAVKSADRGAKVLMGETVPNAQGRRAMAPIAFLRKVACVNKQYKRVRSCPKLKADGYAHHPYDFTRAPRRSKGGKDEATIGSLSNLTKALDKLAHSGQIKGTKNLYLTEYGYLATGKRGLSEAKRASYLRQGFRIARKNRRVKELVQYLLVQPNDSTFTTGLLNSNGSETPSYAALRAS